MGGPRRGAGLLKRPTVVRGHTCTAGTGSWYCRMCARVHVRVHVCVHVCTCVSSQVSPLCRCDKAEAWVPLGPGPHWEGSVEGALWEPGVLAEGGVWGRDRAPLGKGGSQGRGAGGSEKADGV